MAKAVGAIAALVIGGRVVLRHVFRVVARAQMPEVFTGAALLTVLGSAWIMQVAGLSAGLGAFLAGVLLADSEFRHELEAQIDPFKGLLLGLFFIAVGMSIDLQRVLAEPALIAGLVAVLMVVKFAILYLIGRRPGGLDPTRPRCSWAACWRWAASSRSWCSTKRVKAGLIDDPMRDRLAAVVGVSMALTPLLLIAIVAPARANPIRPQAGARVRHDSRRRRSRRC